MKIFSNSIYVILFFIVYGAIKVHAQTRQRFTCFSRQSPCFLRTMTCPSQCPTFSPTNPKAKACLVNCDSPICRAECKNRKPNCSGNGAACYDPRFIGGDGIVFYFHGRSNEHFSLVSDHDLQINARFIGLRPAGRTRDYTWIQALGIKFGSHSFSLEATKASNDCFAHLEVQFRFFSLSPQVEGVLGRTYQPDFENSAKAGVAMAVVGGEDKYKISTLFSTDCKKCIFSPTKDDVEERTLEIEYAKMDCTSRVSKGYGIVCKK